MKRNVAEGTLHSGSWSGQKTTLRRGVSLKRFATVLKQPRIAALLWILAILHLIWVFSLLPGREKKIDFSVYYTAAVAVHAHINPYTADLTPLAKRLGLNLDTQTHIAETPFFLLAFEPLATVSPEAAYWIWFSISLAALGLSMILLLSRVGSGSAALGALMLLYPPLTRHFLIAQSQILVLLLLTCLLLALEKEKDALSGFLLAVAGALRAYPLAMAAYLLLTRRLRALASTVLFLVIITALTVFSLGPSFCLAWFDGLLYAAKFGANPLAVSLPTFISRFFWFGFGMELAGPLALWRSGTIAIAEAALLVLSTRATLRSPKHVGFSVWIVAAILLSPIAWTHYLVLLFIPFSEMAARADRGEWSERAIWAMIGSYVLTVAASIAMGSLPTDRELSRWIWVGQGFSASVLLAYLSVYWLATARARTARYQEAITGPRVAPE